MRARTSIFLTLLLATLTSSACGGAAVPTPRHGNGVARGASVLPEQMAALRALELPPSEAPPPTVEPPVDPGAREGRDAEHPVMRCGPADSYRYVAELRCRDGSQPLHGDAREGSAARSGNVGANSTGHIIDLYVVPCPEGPLEVYVDLYGCPEFEQQLIR